MHKHYKNTNTLVTGLSSIGIALSAERNHTRLMEMILQSTMQFTNADAGTLYLRSNTDQLNFEIIHNISLGIHSGGDSGNPIDFPPIKLYDEQGNANHNMVSAWAAINGKTVNIADAYSDQEFDFSGTCKFDESTGYRSTSFLTVPMLDHEQENIGVLQLINAKDDQNKRVIPFSKMDQYVVESLSSQAAVALSNQALIAAQKELFDSLIKLIAQAVDAKSPYTAGHCNRVPVITSMLAEAVCRTQQGVLKDFNMTEAEKYELSVAAWLHDCGKITTPEYVVDKATKLETIFDREELVKTRIEILKRDATIEALSKQLKQEKSSAMLAEDAELQQRLNTLRDYQLQIGEYNKGRETITTEVIEQIDKMAAEQWMNAGSTQPLLTENEVKNLKISRGTLNDAEREIINNHINVTIQMLTGLPYPKHLRRVPEFAGGHHERVDGNGYPYGLTREQMSIPARMLAIADIFEALTASDRPYKNAMPLSRTLDIMGKLKEEGHVDPDLFDVFMNEKVYLDYAKQHLSPAQIDIVN